MEQFKNPYFMNAAIITEKQTTLVEALNQKPNNKTIPVNKYFEGLKTKFFCFQQELEDNVRNSNSVRDTLEYLSKSFALFQNSYKFFECSLDILFYPIEQKNQKRQRISNYDKAHVFIFKLAIDRIIEKTKDVKYAFENNILTKNIIQLSKYVIQNSKCQVIDIVELGFALYHTEYFINRNGEALQLYEFIENLGQFFGIEIINIRQRIIELHRRVKNPAIFLVQLTHSYSNNLKPEK